VPARWWGGVRSWTGGRSVLIVKKDPLHAH